MIHPPALALEQILDRSPFGIAVFDYEGLYESVNPTYCAIYGYTQDELLGRSITTVFPADRHAWVVGLHRKFLDEGGVLDGEWEVLRRDQMRLQVISESVLLVGDDGRKRRLVFVMDITERRKLEQALQTSEERLQLVMRGTEDGYFDADLVSGKRSYSSRWWQMLGYAPDAWPLDGNHWQRLTHPDDLPRVLATIDAALCGSADRFEVPIRMRHRDGQYRSMLTRAFIGRNAQGQAVRLTGANTDLTERVRFEWEARHFQSIVESSEDAIISKSLDSVVTSWNGGAEAMFGYSAAEMIGRTITVLLPPDRLGEEERILARLRDGEKVEHFETVRQHRDGRLLQVSVTISPIRDYQGRIVGASKIARNITEKKALEARLEHLAHHDALTDLPNRVLLADRIRQAMILARRQGFGVAVLYIDLDGFKQVNDLHGHACGDDLLVALARRMTEALREADTLSRIGGDEFAAVLSNVKGLEECKPVLQRVLTACCAPVNLGGKRVEVSASIGVALYPQQDVTAEQLLSHADRAMYQAKQAGKNQYQVFDS